MGSPTEVATVKAEMDGREVDVRPIPTSRAIALKVGHFVGRAENDVGREAGQTSEGLHFRAIEGARESGPVT